MNIIIHGDYKDGKTGFTRHTLTECIAKDYTFNAVYADVEKGVFQEIIGLCSEDHPYEVGVLNDNFSFQNIVSLLEFNRRKWPHFHQVAIMDGLTANHTKLITKLADYAAKEQFTSVNIMNYTHYNWLLERNLLPHHEDIELAKLKMNQLLDIAIHRANVVHDWYPPIENLKYASNLIGMLDNVRAGSCAHFISHLRKLKQDLTYDLVSDEVIKHLDIDSDTIFAFDSILHSLDENERLCLRMISEYMCRERKSCISKRSIVAFATLWCDREKVSRKSLLLPDSLDALLTKGIIGRSSYGRDYYVWIRPELIYDKTK